jgi:hypothetical protein
MPRSHPSGSILGPPAIVETSCEFELPEQRVWAGITDAVMTLPKPVCFNLGVPLPRTCEITSSVQGVGKTRRCTSDKGTIEQEITEFIPYKRLSFHMVAHNLRTTFAIGAMDDRFVLEPCGPGIVRLTRTTRISIPLGFAFTLRRLAIKRSLVNVHRYVYRNIRGSAPSVASALPTSS